VSPQLLSVRARSLRESLREKEECRHSRFYGTGNLRDSQLAKPRFPGHRPGAEVD
jgi:hypothetical protein